MTKTPWLDLEMPARAYRGGDFVASLMNDFNTLVPRLGLGATCKFFSSASVGIVFEYLQRQSAAPCASAPRVATCKCFCSTSVGTVSEHL
jgi:hypothetical protein